jgi:type 1 glutamine amidotransferase
MNLPQYRYFASDDFKDYEFYSKGPNGRIKKLVVYEKINDKPLIYNLAFGDEEPETGLLLDRVKSSNDDRDTILATVAHTIGDFSDHYGRPIIHIVGSTTVRTRLYQMSIAKIYDEICAAYTVQGYRDGAWEFFQKNVNYEAFVVQKN